MHRLPAGSRVGDAIDSAGGYSAQVDIAASAQRLNLAQRLQDGDKIQLGRTKLPAREITLDRNDVGEALHTSTFLGHPVGCAAALASIEALRKPKKLADITGEEGLQEWDYADLEEDKTVTPGKSSDGWLGITDKYWAAALLPENEATIQAVFSSGLSGTGGACVTCETGVARCPARRADGMTPL